MKEELDQNKEEALLQKLNAKRRLRGLLIILNTIVGMYLLFCIGSLVYNLMNPTPKENNEFTLCGYQTQESNRLYAQFASKTFDGDFATYGNSWSIVEGMYGKDKERVSSIQAVPVCSMRMAKNLEYHPSLFWDETMSLEKDQDGNWLEEGDYLFLKDYVDLSNVGEAFRVNGLREKVEMTHYSLPMENGKRVQTTLIADPKNPAFVMRVQYVDELPVDVYDMVIWKKERSLDLSPILEKIPENMKIMSLDEQATIQDCLLTSSTYMVSIDKGAEEKVYISEMLNKEYEGMQKQDTSFIKVMAGYAYKDNELDPDSFISTRYMGKMTFEMYFKQGEQL